jgi:NAD/NADP transhydrogenase alpha subunit
MATGTAGTDARQYHSQQVHYLRKRITFADDDVLVTVGRIPARSSIVGGGVHIVTAFTAGSCIIDVGFTGSSATADPNAYATALVVTAVGYIVLDELAATTNIQSTTDHLVTATLSSGSTITAGVADVIIMYVVDNDG